MIVTFIVWGLIVMAVLLGVLAVVVLGAMLIGLVVRIVRALLGRDRETGRRPIAGVVHPAGPDVRADLTQAIRRAGR